VQLLISAFAPQIQYFKRKTQQEPCYLVVKFVLPALQELTEALQASTLNASAVQVKALSTTTTQILLVAFATLTMATLKLAPFVF